MLLSHAVAGFSPSQSGLHYANSFPPGTSFPAITVPILGTLLSGDAHNGLCDGFAYTVLDLFLSSPRVSPPPDTRAPAPGTQQFNYLVNRTLDSFVPGRPSAGNLTKAIDWIQTPGHDVTISLYGKGLGRRMAEDEWPLIKADIDADRPSPVYLVREPQCGAGDIPGMLVALRRSHHVLAYSYSYNDQTHDLSMAVYDCNDPGDNGSVIALNLSHPEHTLYITAPQVDAHLGTEAAVRGFFRSSYVYKNPIEFCQVHEAMPIGRRAALRTSNGHTVTMVNGGGLGPMLPGLPAPPLVTNARAPGAFERFHVEWLDGPHTQLALKTANGHYLTAVNGGGVGGANDVSSPVHTDATWVGPWERLTLHFDTACTAVAIQTPDGHYVTATNGGGLGGSNEVPFHTDATRVGPWERFTIIPL